MIELAGRVRHVTIRPRAGVPQEAAEHIKSLLALQLPQVNVEVDDLVVKETEDRQNI